MSNRSSAGVFGTGAAPSGSASSANRQGSGNQQPTPIRPQTQGSPFGHRPSQPEQLNQPVQQQDERPQVDEPEDDLDIPDFLK